MSCVCAQSNRSIWPIGQDPQRYSAFPKASALLEPHLQIILSHNLDTRCCWWGLPLCRVAVGVFNNFFLYIFCSYLLLSWAELWAANCHLCLEIVLVFWHIIIQVKGFEIYRPLRSLGKKNQNTFLLLFKFCPKLKKFTIFSLAYWCDCFIIMSN